MNELQNEFEIVRKQNEGKCQEADVIERELKKLQDKYREAMAQIYTLQTDKNHLEASLKLAQEEVTKFN